LKSPLILIKSFIFDGKFKNFLFKSRSLRNKADYNSNIIEDYDIVFFTETHLDKLVLDKNIHFSDYDIPVRKDRNSDGGGIIM
jgi:hypothetical protein